MGLLSSFKVNLIKKNSNLNEYVIKNFSLIKNYKINCHKLFMMKKFHKFINFWLLKLKKNKTNLSNYLIKLQKRRILKENAHFLPYIKMKQRNFFSKFLSKKLKKKKIRRKNRLKLIKKLKL